MQKLGGYFRKPTFLCLVGQGLFGAIPWNAFGYSTMLLDRILISIHQFSELRVLFWRVEDGGGRPVCSHSVILGCLRMCAL